MRHDHNKKCIEHKFKHCEICNVIYCKKCEKEWREGIQINTFQSNLTPPKVISTETYTSILPDLPDIPGIQANGASIGGMPL